jgi:putative lipase involved disintegration of autophagic bodies
MENALQVQNIMKITNDVEADNLLTDIKELQADESRFEIIANAKIQQIKEDLQKKKESIGNAVQLKKDMLRAYFLQVPHKASKTQETYKLLSGTLIRKNPSTKIEVADREKLIQYAETSAQDYIKIKTDVDWAGFKKVLDIDGDKVINKETGEVLGELEGLTVKEVGEIFDIKL